MVKNLKDRTVILGWGSLINEYHKEFDSQHEDWIHEGPILPIEFSRISSSRLDTLTLVIDPDNGTNTIVWYATSKHSDPADAACDLRTRENTNIRNIGMIDMETGLVHSHWSSVKDKVKLWAESKRIRAVVWTDLASNFAEKKKINFSVEEAIKHIKDLPKKWQESARNYIKVVPKEVVTPFRTAISDDPWFFE